MRKNFLILLAAPVALTSTLAHAEEKIVTLPKVEVVATKDSLTSGSIMQAREKIKSIPGDGRDLYTELGFKW